MSEASKMTAVQWAKALHGSAEVTPELVKEMQELDSKWSGTVPNMNDTEPVDLFKNMVNPIPGVNAEDTLYKKPYIEATLKLENGEDLKLTSDPYFIPDYPAIEKPDAATSAFVKELLKEPENPNKQVAHGFLDEAAGVMKQRAALRDSEDGERTAAQIAKIFNAITGNSISEADAWLFLIVMKIVRSRNGKYNRDDYVDLAAYAALLGETESQNRK